MPASAHVLNSIDNFSSAVCQTQVPKPRRSLPSGTAVPATRPSYWKATPDRFHRAGAGGIRPRRVRFRPFLFVSEVGGSGPGASTASSRSSCARANSRGPAPAPPRRPAPRCKAEHLGVVLTAVRAQAGLLHTQHEDLLRLLQRQRRVEQSQDNPNASGGASTKRRRFVLLFRINSIPPDFIENQGILAGRSI
jgi:hypothetical protein